MMAGYDLLPVLPELVLAIGAMALLMVGAWRGTPSTGLITGLAVFLLVVTGALVWWLPAGSSSPSAAASSSTISHAS